MMRSLPRILNTVSIAAGCILLSLLVSTKLSPRHRRSRGPRPESAAATSPGEVVRHLLFDPKTVQLRPVLDENLRRDASIPVFYNVFTNSEKDVPRVVDIVAEQFSQLRPEHRVLVRSIGTPIASEVAKIKTNSRAAEFIQHDSEGYETSTLHLLWEHCRNNPADSVVYIHSKGSFHHRGANGAMRRFLTRGALSEECANSPPSVCNVCSSRMSPVPHPHTPGNMWLARCEYVRRLVDPTLFESRMEEVPFDYGTRPNVGHEHCIGKARFAAEHWVHSHPGVMPCDLHGSPSYVWNYKGIPSVEELEAGMELKPAPRFEHSAYRLGRMCGGWGSNVEDRLLEYETLYREKPSDQWWGWKFFDKKPTNVVQGRA